MVIYYVKLSAGSGWKRFRSKNLDFPKTVALFSFHILQGIAALLRLSFQQNCGTNVVRYDVLSQHLAGRKPIVGHTVYSGAWPILVSLEKVSQRRLNYSRRQAIIFDKEMLRN